MRRALALASFLALALPASAFARGEFERNVVRVESGRTEGHERAERMLGDERVKNLGARLLEMRRVIHGPRLCGRDGGLQSPLAQPRENDRCYDQNVHQ